MGSRSHRPGRPRRAAGRGQSILRSSAMTLPSFGRLPGTTKSTAPLSLVRSCSVAPTAALRASVGARGLGRERHRVGLGLAGHDKPQALELGMAPPDLGHLLRAHEHALDLRGLIGAAHPALDAQVGAPARARAGQRRREVAEREADLRVMRIEVRDHDLADIALGDRVAGARPHDLDDQVLVDDHAGARPGLIGDDADIGGRVGLVGVDAARGDVLLEGFREGGAGDQRLPDAGGIAAGFRCGIEEDLEEVRRAAIGDRPEGGDHLELLLGLAGPGRDDDAAERPGARIHHEAARHRW